MRIRQEVIKTLQGIKSGSSFCCDPVHVTPEYMDNIIKYVHDYAMIERWKTNKKYRFVSSDVENPVMNAMLVNQEKVLVSLCEPYVLEPFIAKNWHVVCRVKEGQPVNGRPTTRILDGKNGSLRLCYNYGTELLQVSGACTTQVPLVSISQLPSPATVRKQNEELRGLFFIYENTVCRVMWTETLYVPLETDSYNRVTKRECYNFIWCIHVSKIPWTHVHIFSHLKYCDLHYEWSTISHLCFSLTKEDILPQVLSPLHVMSLLREPDVFGLIDPPDFCDEVRAAKYLIRTVLAMKDLIKKKIIKGYDAVKIAEEIDWKGYSMNDLMQIPRIYKFELPIDRSKNTKNKKEYCLLLAKFIVVELNRYQLVDEAKYIIGVPPTSMVDNAGVPANSPEALETTTSKDNNV